MEKPHQIEVTHESHYAPIRNPDQSQAIALRKCRNHPVSLSFTHISDVVFALSESFVILSVTPIRGGVTDERGEGSRYIWLA
jgi:hypothetical protein